MPSTVAHTCGPPLVSICAGRLPRCLGRSVQRAYSVVIELRNTPGAPPGWSSSPGHLRRPSRTKTCRPLKRCTGQRRYLRATSAPWNRSDSLEVQRNLECSFDARSDWAMGARLELELSRFASFLNRYWAAKPSTHDATPVLCVRARN